MIQKTNKNMPRRNKYILENIFKFYILKYVRKFFKSHDNNKKKNSAFIISRNTCKKLAEHQCSNYLPSRSIFLHSKVSHCTSARIEMLKSSTRSNFQISSMNFEPKFCSQKHEFTCDRSLNGRKIRERLSMKKLNVEASV